MSRVTVWHRTAPARLPAIEVEGLRTRADLGATLGPLDAFDTAATGRFARGRRVSGWYERSAADARRAGAPRPPVLSVSDLGSLDALRAAFAAREGAHAAALATRMDAARREGGAGAVFDAWMLRESDAVQALARAYAERLVLDAVAAAAAADAVVAPPLTACATLWALRRMEADALWWVTAGGLPVATAAALPAAVRESVRALAGTPVAHYG